MLAVERSHLEIIAYDKCFMSTINPLYVSKKVSKIAWQLQQANDKRAHYVIHTKGRPGMPQPENMVNKGKTATKQINFNFCPGKGPVFFHLYSRSNK